MSKSSQPKKLPPAAAGSSPAPARKRVYARRRATSRDQVLTEWRGVDLRADEVVIADTEQPAGDVLKSVLSRLKLDQKSKETEVMKVWNALMDQRVAAHAQPAGIVRGTLFVNVDSSVWMDEIVRYQRKEILHRLQTAFGHEMIQRISFRIG